ncbi:MAG TPA: glycerate kinase, partial [Candidatus Limnocylindria bacterium]
MTDRPLRVVVAPDSFGGALASPGVAAAIAAGWSRARPTDLLDLAPMADGGEGTLAALCVALGDRADRRSLATVDALGRPITAEWLLIDDGEAAFIEMATASGLAHLSVEERTPANARIASSRGTGELVRAALDAGARTITLGLGGSATTDGGSGMLVALGARLLDESEEELPPGGAALARLARIDASGLDARLADVPITIASDVTNTLCGPAGAAATYGPQKGCDEWAVAELDRALLHWGRMVEEASGRSVVEESGAGAAGGTTSALLGFTRAGIRPGVEVVAEEVHLADLLAAADLV